MMLEVSVNEDLNDEELMSAYIAGDKMAFQFLYDRYEDRLLGFFRRRLSSRQRAIAPDLFQATWLKVHQARAKFDRAHKFSSWFFTIALNTLRDFVGEARHRFETPDDSIISQTASSSSEELKHDLNQLETLLDRLPSFQREVILLSDWEELSSKEIAVMYDTSDGNIRQMIFRTRKQLKSWLEGDGLESKTRK